MPYYGYYYGADLGYYAVVLASIVLGGLAQAFIKSTYRKWSNVSASIPGTGAEVARRMLDEGGRLQRGHHPRRRRAHRLL